MKRRQKTVQTTNGEIVIPTNPQRIVAEEYIASLLVLDVKPVGAPGLALENYYLKEALKSVEDIGVYGKPSSERILGLKPDLIITGNGENYDALSKIAPTVVIPYGELKKCT
ncbi:ABC transporter substrate-binding protein [Lysinibacillus sp. MHQ-1]|nr:ABC transporter substrate-binding protein [Lysinibacillus sp. MHQ-1]